MSDARLMCGQFARVFSKGPSPWKACLHCHTIVFGERNKGGFEQRLVSGKVFIVGGFSLRGKKAAGFKKLISCILAGNRDGKVPKCAFVTLVHPGTCGVLRSLESDTGPGTWIGYARCAVVALLGFNCL